MKRHLKDFFPIYLILGLIAGVLIFAGFMMTRVYCTQIVDQGYQICSQYDGLNRRIWTEPLP